MNGIQEERINWHTYWMEVAKLTARRSLDPKHKVGCVIVSIDNERMLSMGYNGDHKGGSNERLSLESGQSGFIHAENNALIKLNYHDPCLKRMYVTLSPCYSCAQLIINAGIKQVIYFERYNDEGIDLLVKHGVEVFLYSSKLKELFQHGE